MAHNAPENPKLAVPAEYARAEWQLENPPSLAGLKLLTVALAHAPVGLVGPFDVPVAALRAIPALHGLAASELLSAVRSLMASLVVVTAPAGDGVMRDRLGPILMDAIIDRRDGRSLALRLQFSPAFAAMALDSDVYTLLDRALIVGLRSRYSVLLYQYLASHWRKSSQRSVKLTVAEWRKVFAVPPGEYPRFATLFQRVIAPAIAEVSAVGPFDLRMTREYTGRAVSALGVVWVAKSDAEPVDVAPAVPKRSGAPVARTKAAAAPPRATAEAVLVALAERLNGGRYVSPAEVSTSKAAALIAAGLVSPEVLRSRGLG